VEPLGTDMYLPAFPRMAAELHATPSGVQLTLTTFMVGLGAGHLVFGPLSDRVGRRGPLLAGTAVAAVSAGACALAPSLGWLLGFRLLQGFSAASGLVIGRSVVSDVTHGRQAARLFGILMALLGIAPIVAPLAGSAVMAVAEWRAVFWVLTAAMLVMLAGVALAVPESLPRHRRRSGGMAATLAGARAVLADRAYLGYTLAFALAFAAVFCYIGGSSFLYQNVLGLSYAQSSWAVAGTVLVHSSTAMVSAKLVARVHPVRLVHTGMAAMLVATVLLGLVVLTGLMALPAVLAVLAVFFVGSGLVMPNASALALDRLTHAAGTGSAVLGTLQNGLAAVAAPLVGLVAGHLAESMVVVMAASVVLAVAALGLTRGRHSATGPAGP
jgi:DHA1 family bicyclomycin/chloramphenicol resistance-like MFS transporter